MRLFSFSVILLLHYFAFPWYVLFLHCKEWGHTTAGKVGAAIIWLTFMLNNYYKV